MATVKQVLAAISQDGTLGPNQKRFVTEAVQRAEEWIKIQTANTKPRKISNGKNLITLEEWEAQNGMLRSTMIWDWIRSQKLCPQITAKMIQEFREEMIAKGKQYANFKLAFQTYLTKGYLSKPLASCTLERSPYKAATVIETKGGVL